MMACSRRRLRAWAAARSLVELAGVRRFEISIEVSERDLQAYGLTLGQVTRAVQANSLDLPGGSVKTDAGEILARVEQYRKQGVYCSVFGFGLGMLGGAA